jgi:hypothetical protein
MFIDGVVIGVIIALIMGGKLSNLLSISIKYSWLILIGFSIQFAAIFIFPDHLLMAIIISNVALLSFCYLNRKQIGFNYMTIGILLNVIVMLANGGRMPVEPDAAKILSPEDFPELVAGEYGKHVVISTETHLNFLGDIFFLNHPYPRPIIISIGDIILSIGIILFLYKSMVTRPVENKEVMENAT